MKRILGFCLLSLACTKPGGAVQETVMNTKPHKLEVLNWQLSAADISSRCQLAQETLKNEIASIVATQTPNLENTLERADRAFSAFTNQTQPLDFYRYVLKDAKLQEAAKNCFEESERLHLSIVSRHDFYNIIKKASESDKPKDAVQNRLLEDYFHTFKENGLFLSEEKREELLKLRNELVNIQSTFSQVLNAWDEKLHFSKDELQGLPDGILGDLEASTEKGKDYILTLKYPHVIPALKYVKDAGVRKKIYERFKSRGGKENSGRLAKAIGIRLKIAKLLGYSEYAAYRLDNNMAKNPETVMHFLTELQTSLHDRAKKEFETLLNLKRRDLHDPKLKTLNPWDEAFYETILLKEQYHLSEEEVKQYFPVTKTIEGMLNIYQTILGLDFVVLPDAPVWHADVKAFRVVDHNSGDLIGQFYMDLFPRDGKYSHAAMFGLISAYQKEDGEFVLPISSVVANFSKPTKDDPGLLNHDEVETLFHEFGHVMHHVLSRAKNGNFAGTNVKRDFVEAPSQMMENWVWEKPILKTLTSHYKTGANMPDELIERLIKTRSFNKGIFYTRQIFYASIDMAYHTLKNVRHLDVTGMYHKYYHDIYMLNALKNTRPEASFDHLMGGYDAGYYGYLWSKVYASDMYTRFESEGLLNADTGRDYRKTILEQGGSQDPMNLVSSFLKRKPNNEAFLRLIQENSIAEH